MTLLMKPMMMTGKIRIDEIAVERREIAEASSTPLITKRPPSVRIISVARLVAKMMTGIRLGEQPQDAEADVPRLGVGREEFLVLVLLRVQQPDERRAQDALVDHLVQPVDRLLRLEEQLPHPAEHDVERARR